MSLQMLEEEEEKENQSISNSDNDNDSEKSMLVISNNNNDQLNINEQLLSHAFSQIVSSNSFQFPISMSKDQLYESFLLFQNVLKSYQNNKKGHLHSSKSNKCVLSHPFANLITETKEDDRRITNTNTNVNYKDNSRNNGGEFYPLNSGLNNTNNNFHHSNKYNFNYDDKPIRPANDDFMALVEKNLEKESNKHKIDNSHHKNNTHKNIIKESKCIKKSLLKVKKEKKNKIYLDNSILNPNVDKNKDLNKTLKNEEIKTKDLGENNNLKNIIMKQENIGKIIEPMIFKEDEDLVHQKVSFNSQNEALILVTNKIGGDTINEEIQPLKEIQKIKVKTNKLFLQNKSTSCDLKNKDGHCSQKGLCDLKKTSNSNSNSNNNDDVNANTIYNHNTTTNQIDTLSSNKMNIFPNQPYLNYIQKRTLSSIKEDSSSNNITIGNTNNSYQYNNDINNQLKLEQSQNVKEQQKKSIKRDQAINAKMEELDIELVYFKREKEKVHQLKEEYEHLHETLQDHTNQFNTRKSEFEEYKLEEELKIEREKNQLMNDENKLKVIKEGTQLLQEIFKQDKIIIDTLKNQVDSIQLDIRQKDDIRKNKIEKLKKQFDELLIKHINANANNKCELIRKNNNSNSHSNTHSNNYTKSTQTPVLNKEKKPLKTIYIKSSNSSNSYSKHNNTNCSSRANNKKFGIINNNISININHVSTPIKQTKINTTDINCNIKNTYCNNTNSHQLSTEYNTISHKSLKALPIPIENREDLTDSYDFVFPDKYHKVYYSLLNEERSSDGKIIRMYTNEKREIVFKSGVRKELYKEGYQIVYFTNGDMKQIFPELKSVYYFKEAQTVQTVFNNGLQVFKFANGQLEKHYLDGSKRIIYSNGSIRMISKEGQEQFYLNDTKDTFINS